MRPEGISNIEQGISNAEVFSSDISLRYSLFDIRYSLFLLAGSESIAYIGYPVAQNNGLGYRLHSKEVINGEIKRCQER
jgi:hypothetical protein